MLDLKVILVSTRPGRRGPLFANWIVEEARAHEGLNVTLIDLKEENLPFLDEPHHPKAQKYTQQHTKDWSAKIGSADAFIFVLAEYNHGYPATIKNAIDFLFHEWRHKPVGFVSYGGIAAGTRSMQALKQVTAALEMFPLTAAVNIANFATFIKDDVYTPSDEHKKNAGGLMKELVKWGNHFKGIRQPNQ